MKKYIKIFLALVIAFTAIYGLSKSVFLANSPRINPQFLTQSSLFLKNLTAKKSGIIYNSSKSKPFVQAKDQLSTSVKEALDASLKETSKGVYAGEKNNIKIYKFKQSEIEWIEYTFTVNGKQVKIKVPKDQEKPTQEDAEQIYSE